MTKNEILQAFFKYQKELDELLLEINKNRNPSFQNYVPTVYLSKEESDYLDQRIDQIKQDELTGPYLLSGQYHDGKTNNVVISYDYKSHKS